MMMKFSRSTLKQLGYYVYGLVDPRDGRIFYIGKASGNNRAFDHLHASPASEGPKFKRIVDIRGSGLEPEVDILRYGLQSEQESFEVEAAIIDTIGIENLTNSVRGHGVDRGRQTSKEIEQLHGSKPVAVGDLTEPLMLFFINQSYSPTKSELQLYDCTRQFWFNISENTRSRSKQTGKLPYQVALAVVESVVVRAYTIAEWFPAGTTFSTRRVENPVNRWEFVGQLYSGHPVVGRRLTKDNIDLPANQLGFGYLN